MSNMEQRISQLEAKAEYTEKNRIENHRSNSDILTSIDKRLRSIEIKVWMGIGGLILAEVLIRVSIIK